MAKPKVVKRKPLTVRVKSDPALRARVLKDPGLRSKLPMSMLTPEQRAQRAAKVPLATRVKSDPALLARALRDPGLRSKLPDKYLTPQLREGRRLNQPILPGASLTNRDAEKQAQAAADLEFGPNAVAAHQQSGRDVQGWYQQYQNDLRTHQANIGQINQGANQANQALSSGIRDIGDRNLQTANAREGAAAKVTGGIAADQTGTESDASKVRQAMIAALGTAQAGVGAARQAFADTRANVVAPGQRLQAAAQSQSAGRKLEREIGAHKALTLAAIKRAEGESVSKVADRALAASMAGTELAKTLNPRTGLPYNIDPETGREYPEPTKPQTPGEKKTQAELDYFNKHGYWPPTGPPKSDKPKVKTKKPPRYGVGSLTQNQENQIAAKINKLVGVLNGSEVKDGKIVNAKGKKIPNNNSAIINTLMAAGLSRHDAHVALSLYRNKGKLGPDGVKSAHAIGLHVNGRYPVLKGARKGTLGSGALNTVVDAVTGAVK